VRPTDFDIEEADELGPGSDLVISLFAMAMLLLGIVGTGYKVEAAKVQELSSSSAANISLRHELTEMTMETARLRTERDRALASLAATRARVDDADRIRLQGNRTRAEFERRAAELEASVKELENRLTEAQARLIRTKNELDEERRSRLARNRAIFELKESKDLAPFERGSAVLTEPAKRIILNRLVEGRSEIANQGANLLLIEGYASPEPIRYTDGRDGNLDLSNQRASAVAYFIVAQGVPFQCVASIGFGRARSDLLRSYLAASGRTLVSWDRQFESEPGRSEVLTRNADLLAAERRVVLRAVVDPTSSCVPDVLVRGLQQLRP
jgi:flagellar motor protein MotB